MEAVGGAVAVTRTAMDINSSFSDVAVLAGFEEVPMNNSGSVAVLNTLPTKGTEVSVTSGEAQPSQLVLGARLQDLIPIAMVIVGGCEPCAENMVNRGLRQGSSWQDIGKTLRIIANMQTLDCFAKAVGADVVARMEKPLAAGRRTLQKAISAASEHCKRPPELSITHK